MRDTRVMSKQQELGSLEALLQAGAASAGAAACVLYRVRPAGGGGVHLEPLRAGGPEGAAASAALSFPENPGRRIPAGDPFWEESPGPLRELVRRTGGASFATLVVDGRRDLAIGLFGASGGGPAGDAQREAVADLLQALLARRRSAGEGLAADGQDPAPRTGPDPIAGPDVIERLAAYERQAAAQAEFLAGLGHELKTPLNAIIGFSSLLERQLRDEELLEEVEMISMSAEKLLGLIDDLIDAYKIQAGKLTLHPEIYNLNEVIANSVETVRVIADERNIRVRTYLDGNVPDFRFDAKRLQQVMNNLLGNAVKFVPAGGEIIVRSMLAPTADMVRVQVADTGEGIPADVLPHIFERFRQAGGSERRDARSAGLGLTLCKDFVEMHGGEIHVTSEPRKGSVFTFTLPLGQDESAGDGAESDEAGAE